MPLNVYWGVEKSIALSLKPRNRIIQIIDTKLTTYIVDNDKF